ncbi:hypothetical protein EN780_03320 [Mesorhizobium sp. M4B.F.Ca.ET.089.01.1.1]|uniref:hypothetical protein n=1 Tax=Mesorhizobium sp. M4B.F.Ca.ET.089.01.1.1 TaxID=2496662 RepID=UPI000FE2AB30|nr:hypothetical protein [Mesorhizobium sp. M4B.F.Ca.ET.089.01.1.1]RWX70438.1 hypothetical protein EN780_03320 [Mesorhizobium sp. M4B.F.Ca.ET.089.01.1.1]
MAYVDVTRLVGDVDPFELSRSIAEAGKDAGPTSWRNATAEAGARPLLTASERNEAKHWLKGFGAWDDDEIAGWSDAEIDALVLQFAAGDLREVQSLCPGDGLGDVNWQEAEALAEHGTVGGRLYPQGESLMIYVGD